MKILSLARDLRRRKARERRSLFVVEGVRAVEELLKSRLEIEGVLIAPQLVDAPRGLLAKEQIEARGLTVEMVTARDFASAAETESPQGIVAVAAVPPRTLDDVPDSDSPILVLDGVQDPGNVGTILRTAAALGVRATVALPGTVDLWNAKVVRSAVGAQFEHLAFATTFDQLHQFLERTRTALWVAAANGVPVSDAPRASRVAIALGNEGAGISDAVSSAASLRVAIPIKQSAESLNVAIAAAILLYELRPR